MTKKKDLHEVDELSVAIAEALNKTFKDGQVAYFIGQEQTPTDLTDFISTGCSLLDLAISNRPHGGIACGRVTELSGLPGTGKSLLAAHMMKEVQQEKGVVVLIDTENAVNPEFYNAIGLDLKKMVYAQPDTVEDIFECIEKIIETVRKKEGNDKKVLIVVDSVSGAPTKKELEGTYEKDGYATEKSIILSKAMRKITQLIAKQKIALVFTNQLRQKMNAPVFSDQYTSSGGMAIPFHSSTRIRLTSLKKLSNKENEVIGSQIKASITKNRLGPPHRTAEFEVYFDRGIDDLSSWLQFLKDKDIITIGGAYCTYEAADGTSYKFANKEWKKFLTENPKLKEEIYNKMCDTMIMSYSTLNLSPDEVQEHIGDTEL